MSELPKGTIWGKPTEREHQLMMYLGECIAQWTEKNNTTRNELMCAFTFICSLLFSKQTPFKDIKAQCEEIDAFCDFLKLRAREGLA